MWKSETKSRFSTKFEGRVEQQERKINMLEIGKKGGQALEDGLISHWL